MPWIEWLVGPNVQGAKLGLGTNGVLFAKHVLEGLSLDGVVEDEGGDLLRFCNQDTYLHLCRDHLATFRDVDAAYVSLGEGGTGFAKVNSLWRKGWVRPFTSCKLVQLLEVVATKVIRF